MSPDLSAAPDATFDYDEVLAAETGRVVATFKKGYRTTEFWAMLGTVAIASLNDVLGLNLDGQTVLGIAGVVATYVGGRTALKRKRLTSLS